LFLAICTHAAATDPLWLHPDMQNYRSLVFSIAHNIQYYLLSPPMAQHYAEDKLSIIHREQMLLIATTSRSLYNIVDSRK
jgi:hypothetical protein